jgi:hypothetical protein
MVDQEKLLRDIDTLKESVRLSLDELASTYTPSDRHNLIKHIQILQGELANLIVQAERLGTVSRTSPFDAGDRVRHAKFGPGTVVTAPIATVGPDPNDIRKIRDAGWRVTVKWDDAGRGEFEVADYALKLEAERPA